MIRVFFLSLIALSTSGCVNSKASRQCVSETWELAYYSKGNDYPGLAAMIRKVRLLMRASQTLLDSEDGLAESQEAYLRRIEPVLSRQMKTRLSDYSEVYFTAEKAGITHELYYKRFDPLLKRRWEPNAVVLDFIVENSERHSIVINELLLSSKIWTGYQGKTTLKFMEEDGQWVIDDVSYSRRYDFEGSKWEESSLYNDLTERVQEMKLRL